MTASDPARELTAAGYEAAVEAAAASIPAPSPEQIAKLRTLLPPAPDEQAAAS
jgi:hypothetical protein